MLLGQTDYLVIGGGIIGLSIARELNRRVPSAKIIVLEKETQVAGHASGRNSGVLHAGFYYTADSLKAKFTRDGNLEMQAYCREHQLPLNPSRKVVVARNESEWATLQNLLERGKANGVRVSLIDENELRSIDSNVKTYRHALLSPDTATVNPTLVTQALKNELRAKGVKFLFEEAYRSRIEGNRIITSLNNVIEARKIYNAAGLYADQIARDFGYSHHYTIIPFKGIYLKYKGVNPPVSLNVYPVPNLKNPFLGVHFTLTVDGEVKIGPTSIPAFWRENYQGFDRFNLLEVGRILGWEARLFLENAFGFRDLAREEVKKYRRSYFVALASSMVHELDSDGFTEWGKPGIRAQLLDKRNHELVMDFVVEGDAQSVHVLNAVSPAFTGAFPFARYVVENSWLTKTSS